MIAQYGKEEGTKIYFAKIRKEAMKTEETAIESELVIQDWNVDDIKFTEVEAIDIIKPEPLKPSPSNWRHELDEDWQKVNRKDKTDGLSKKAVKAYRRENPGSKLQTAVTTKPSKLKKGSKSAKRRLSFCRRMKGMKAKLTSAKTSRDPDSRINKALRRWNCSYEPTGTTIAEKALSKKQQRFFGIVRAAQKGTLDGEASPQVQRAAADMKMKDVKKFASTKHKGLPEKVKSEE